MKSIEDPEEEKKQPSSLVISVVAVLSGASPRVNVVGWTKSCARFQSGGEEGKKCSLVFLLLLLLLLRPLANK